MSRIITTIKLFPEDLKRYFVFYITFLLNPFLSHAGGLYSMADWYVLQPQYVEDLESGFSSDVESKYKKIYEDDINPFAAFSKKVKKNILLLSTRVLDYYLIWLLHMRLYVCNRKESNGSKIWESEIGLRLAVVDSF